MSRSVPPHNEGNPACPCGWCHAAKRLQEQYARATAHPTPSVDTQPKAHPWCARSDCVLCEQLGDARRGEPPSCPVCDKVCNGTRCHGCGWMAKVNAPTLPAATPTPATLLDMPALATNLTAAFQALCRARALLLAVAPTYRMHNEPQTVIDLRDAVHKCALGVADAYGTLHTLRLNLFPQSPSLPPSSSDSSTSSPSDSSGDPFSGSD